MFKKFMCVFISIMLIAVSFSACSDNDGGETFNLAVSELPKHFDPQIADTTTERTIAVNIFDGLFKLDENGTPQKCLVKDYTMSDDGLTYTFILNENVKYFVPSAAQKLAEEKKVTITADVTAEDFAFGITRAVLPETSAPDYELLSVIKNAEKVHKGEMSAENLGIRAVDSHTLEITLERKYDGFLYALTQPVSYPCDEEFFNLTAGRYGLERKYIISNGAFYISAVNEGKSVRIWNNSEYTGAFSAIPQSVGFYLNTQETDIAKAVRKGDYDLGFFSSPEAIGGLGRSANKQELENIGISLVFNMANETLANNNLRTGLVSCIDVTAVTDNPSKAVVPSYYKVNGNTVDGSEVETLSYSIDTARSKMIKAFEELKIENLTVNILCTEEYEAYAKSVISCWQKNIGVELNGTVTVAEKADFTSKLNSGEFDTAICSMTLDSDSAVEYLSMFTSKSSYNLLGYNSAEYDRIVKALKENPNTEQAVYAQSYLLKNAVIFPICTENSVFATAKDVSGIYFVGDTSNIYFYKGQKQ